jgi:hypothetical protein
MISEWQSNGVDEEMLDPVFWGFTNGSAAQKRRFGGEFFPAQPPEGGPGGRSWSSFK